MLLTFDFQKKPQIFSDLNAAICLAPSVKRSLALTEINSKPATEQLRYLFL